MGVSLYFHNKKIIKINTFVEIAVELAVLCIRIKRFRFKV